MGISLGYEVPEHLVVDHIDEDKTNDSLDNLQLLTAAENIDKSNKTRIVNYNFTCSVCGVKFVLTGRQFGNRRNKDDPACSKECAYTVI